MFLILDFWGFTGKKKRGRFLGPSDYRIRRSLEHELDTSRALCSADTLAQRPAGCDLGYRRVARDILCQTHAAALRHVELIVQKDGALVGCGTTRKLIQSRNAVAAELEPTADQWNKRGRRSRDQALEVAVNDRVLIQRPAAEQQVLADLGVARTSDSARECRRVVVGEVADVLRVELAVDINQQKLGVEFNASTEVEGRVGSRHARRTREG